MPFDFNQLPYMQGNPIFQARLKTIPEDFVVEEVLGYSLCGTGEHLWLWVEKRGENTDWVAQGLAKWLGVTSREMGYAGKKDRQAVTRQWFSVHLPGQVTPDLSDCPVPNAVILDAQRHSKKLQTGGLAGNRFRVVLRDCRGDLTDLTQRCERVITQGVPNYFGEQRFGKQMNNLAQATALFAQADEDRRSRSRRHKRAGQNRNQQGMYISAARSWIFNQILAQRLQLGALNQGMAGDVFMLANSQACFVDDGSAELLARLQALEIHPTGALLGRGRLMSQAQMADLEQGVIAQFPEWQNGLEHIGLNQERRALRVVPQDFSWAFEQDSLTLSFGLPAGSYATMVLRELLVATESRT